MILWVESSKERHLFEIEIVHNIINFTFDQFCVLAKVLTLTLSTTTLKNIF